MSDRRFSRGPDGSGNGGGGGGAGSGGPFDFGLSAWDETSEQKPARDLKKAFLVGGLALLSWVATYVGMLELIEANMGDLPIVHKVIIGFSVAMLMTMVVWLLDQLFQPIGFFSRLAYAGGYLFLTIISVGFGFGFYWKVLESRGEGTRGAETAIASVQAPLQTAASRLESLQTTLIRLKETSQSKAELERTAGSSCPNSKPGDGPRRKLRDDDAGRFSFASDFVKGRIGQVKEDMAAIEGDLAKIVQDDRSILDKQGTRNDFMKAMNRKLDGTVTNFNAFRGDPQLKQIRTELAERADKSQFIDTQGKPYSCPDQQLATMIRSVVVSIDALPVLDKPKITTVEGSDATIEAFRRLTATFYGLLSFKLPPSADELRELQKKAMTQAEATAGGRAVPSMTEQVGQGGLSKRDYVPLAIAIFVDLCLLLVSMGKTKSRLQGLVPKMKEAERGPVIQILSRFNEIHRDRQIRENFEIFRHVVFDLNGDYYAAIPLIAPYSVDRRRPNAYGPADVEALQQEAHLLGNFFTSFEQERLFSRVMMPLIPTSRIQKKLWAQGSKFAHAEAFRLYKFKDGAWQEMILGAIMGAAKRVETDKRLRRVENDGFARHTPTGRGSDFDALHGVDLQSHAASAAAMSASVRQPINAPNAEARLRNEVEPPASFAPSVPRPGTGTSGRPVPPPPPSGPADTRRNGMTTEWPIAEATPRDHTFRASGRMEQIQGRYQASRSASVNDRATSNELQTEAVGAANSNTVTYETVRANEATSTVSTVDMNTPVAASDDRHAVEFKERSVTLHLTSEELPLSLTAAIAAAQAQSRTTAAGQLEDQMGQPAIESKVDFDAINGAALEKEQAEVLGGAQPAPALAWDAVAPVDPYEDVATMAQRFGLKRERAKGAA